MLPALRCSALAGSPDLVAALAAFDERWLYRTPDSVTDREVAAAADKNRWMSVGQLRSPIDRVLPLERTAEAHAVQEAAKIQGSGNLSGKIIIEP